MSAEHLTRIQKTLLRRRAALRRSLNLELSLLGRDRQEAADEDEAQEAETDAIFSLLARSESDELARIEYALDRIEEGQYGICDECGGSIPPVRLRALPYATSCIECQREKERRGADDEAVDDIVST